MRKERTPRRVVRPRAAIITGRVSRLDAGYSRELRVGQPILMAVLAAAGVAKVIVLLITSVLQAGTGKSSTRRRWKQLRKGPEFLVTPLRIRDGDGVLLQAVEIHGHLPQSALEPADHVQVTLRKQKDPELPPRVERIVNLTTGQLLTPRIPTVWSHLGPVLVLQAMLGLLLLGTVAACTVTVAR